MKIFIGLGHPAHYLLFKNFARKLKNNGNDLSYVITPKDILEELLITNNEKYYILAQRESKNNLKGKLLKLIRSTYNLVKLSKNEKIDFFIGCIPQIALAGYIRKKPAIFLNEDDFSYTWMLCMLTYPFASNIISPTITNVGPRCFKHKKISYNGYQKLAYLHPNYFSTEKRIKDSNKKQILIRLVNLTAYHDLSAKGINNIILKNFIETFSKDANIFISSERNLPDEFQQYKINIDINKIHEFLLNCDLFIGDSQSMAVEASLLGVPNIRINSFAKKISVINELENKYKLTCSLNPENANQLIDISRKLLNINNQQFQQRREKMLADKIDVTAFMVWFVENYPESAKIMKENPDYQYRFK